MSLPETLAEHAEYFVIEVIDQLKRGEQVDDVSLDILLNWIECAREDIENAAIEDFDDDQDRDVAHLDSVMTAPPIFEQIIEESRNLLRHGLRDAAIARLEKLAFPKWDSEDACRAAYVRHMKAQRAAKASPTGATS